MSKGHSSGSSTWRLTNRRVAPLQGEYNYNPPDTDLHIKPYAHLHMRLYADMDPAQEVLEFDGINFETTRASLLLAAQAAERLDQPRRNPDEED